jgi:hypothetical protein
MDPNRAYEAQAKIILFIYLRQENLHHSTYTGSDDKNMLAAYMQAGGGYGGWGVAAPPTKTQCNFILVCDFGISLSDPFHYHFSLGPFLFLLFWTT